MKLLGTFLCLSLIHLCHCVGDGNDKGATNALSGSADKPVDPSVTGHNGPHDAPVEPPTDPSSGDSTKPSTDPSSDASTDNTPTTPPKPEERDVKLDLADLAKVDFKAFTLSESKVDGILVRKTFSTNDHHHLKEVVDGPATLWESDKDEAKSVVVHYDGGAPALVLLKLSDSHSKHFSKNGNKWVEVTGDEHKELVDKLNAKHAPKAD